MNFFIRSALSTIFLTSLVGISSCSYAQERPRVDQQPAAKIATDEPSQLRVTLKDLAGLYYLGKWPKSFVGLRDEWRRIEMDSDGVSGAKSFPPDHGVKTKDGYVVTKLDIRTLYPTGPSEDKINFVVFFLSKETCLKIEGVSNWFGTSPVRSVVPGAHGGDLVKQVEFWDEHRVFFARAGLASDCVETITVKEKPPYFSELPESSEQYYRAETRVKPATSRSP